jgi:hypothetical protein
MKKTLLVMVGVAAFAGAAQAQDSTTSYGPFRFGVGPSYGSAFDNSAARFEKDNPVNQMPWTDRVNAAPSGPGPQLGPEGSGTPMSRGGVNDTLTGPNPAAIFTAPVKPKSAKRTDKPKTADAKAQAPARP